MVIDEEGEYRMRGKNESDHNSIIVNLEVKRIQKNKIEKKTTWNLKATDDKWHQLRDLLKLSEERAYKIMKDTSKSISERYTRWE